MILILAYNRLYEYIAWRYKEQPTLKRVYADVFKALADETRLTIMALLLRHGKLCVCDVMRVLTNFPIQSITASAISQENAGLLDNRREGTLSLLHDASSSRQGAGPGSSSDCRAHLISS
ncbi:hypothetical protein S1OALGB6SA_341 [Olavius algarvensis spirochete endosymbiont]|uniref:ArsR/SmtB family transcription factor n=1 Tax=Olavius algarvensis spirochete endosymbiont TaxID=260710 RepID=UPI000F21ED02|nr:metalloregulator ArsR/SmtB family transcription factor [Olavius algarvensis spirochete endosymbiont]VDA99278.1 hypothetical protein S1OALGB6SA_341 [Olavius algarvensis spirochete endosymbiont]